MRNIDDFNQDIALYLSKLYRLFPRKDYITPDDVGLNFDGFRDDAEQDRLDAAIAAAHWLLEEGYVRGQKHPTGVMLVTLTSRSWEILQKPSSLDRQKIWGEVVIDLAKNAGKDAGTQAQSRGVAMVLSALTGGVL